MSQNNQEKKDHQLVQAVMSNSLLGVKCALNQGANAGFDDSISLIWAAREQSQEIMRVLVGAGANPNARRGAAIRESAEFGRIISVRALLELGADPNISPDEPLGVAAIHNQHQVVSLLLTHGADASANESRALSNAAWVGNTEALRLLLRAGADPNADGGLPLAWAAMGNHGEAIEMLIAAGADMNARNGAPLRVAAEEGCGVAIERLISHGADARKVRGAIPVELPAQITMAKATQDRIMQQLLFALLRQAGPDRCLQCSPESDFLFLVRAGVVSASQALSAAQERSVQQQLLMCV